MALQQDERALLQLICERGQSYGDLAGLLSVPEDEVRRRARAALTELGGADPDAEVGLTDYLLGQADPIGRADVVRYIQADEATRELAESILTQLQLIAPKGEFPRLPERRGRRREPAAPRRSRSRGAVPPPTDAESGPEHDGAADRRRASAGGGRTPSQSRLIAAIAGLGVILIFVILAIAGVFSSEGEEPVNPAEEQRTITPVALSPQGGSGVAGSAQFGLADSTLFADVELDGLRPRPQGESVYVLWLMLTEDAGYPVSLLTPDSNGAIQDRYVIPAPVAQAVGSRAQSVRISQSPAGPLGRQIDEAAESGAPLVPFSGQTLAAGDIPLAAGTEEGAPAPEGDTGTAPAE